MNFLLFMNFYHVADTQFSTLETFVYVLVGLAIKFSAVQKNCKFMKL